MQMRLKFLLGLMILLMPILANGQVLFKTYYPDNTVKEEFYVRSEQDRSLEGPYRSFYESGAVKSEGQFIQNKSTGTWKYYFENGKLRMEGEIVDGKGVGSWQYFYENGSPKMTGSMLNGKKDGFWTYFYKNSSKESEGYYKNGEKTGIWKYYHAHGVLKATEEFSGIGSYYEELYETGGIKSEGKRLNGKQVDEWLYYHEDGAVQARGSYKDGKRVGNWQYFDEGGHLEAEGRFDNGVANGLWLYYYPDGTLSSQGNLVQGEKDGNWKLFYNDGSLKGEANYAMGDGAYREYYKSGALKVKGNILKGANNGLWEYYYEDGKLEGSCNYDMGEGEYKGYYHDGAIKMKGMIKDDIKIGIWELYEPSGDITGYYKPYYEEGESAFFIAEDTKEQQQLTQVRRAAAGTAKKFRKKSRYFNKRIHEYKALILGYNPVAPLVGVAPISAEYYLEERLGHEMMFQYWRQPFFRSFESMNDGIVAFQGGALTFKQKYYHKESAIGQPYFGHELKYTLLYYSTNLNGIAVQGGSEQKFEYGLFIGTRYFKNVTTNGFTVDSYIGFGAGYRHYNQLYVTPDPATDPFRSINKNKFAYSIRIGVNLGYAFRIRR